MMELIFDFVGPYQPCSFEEKYAGPGSGAPGLFSFFKLLLHFGFDNNLICMLKNIKDCPHTAEISFNYLAFRASFALIKLELA